MNRSLKTIQKVQSRAFFKKMPMATVKDHLDMYGPTSIQKIEYESYLANLDIFQQFDHGRAEITVGEGTKENPYLLPSRNNAILMFCDESAEAPGVAGLGCVPWTFMCWADGDGESGEGMTRSPYSGEYFKVIPFEMPEIECADHHSGH